VPDIVVGLGENLDLPASRIFSENAHNPAIWYRFMTVPTEIEIQESPNIDDFLIQETSIFA
jgi:hypothetical protein